MIKFSKEELLKLAKLSALKLDETETEMFIEQLNKIINYTEELAEVDLTKLEAAVKNVNIFRDDKVVPTDSKDIVKQAPKNKDNYFVVPKILN